MVMAPPAAAAEPGVVWQKGRLQKELRTEELRGLALSKGNRWLENRAAGSEHRPAIHPLPPSCRGTTSTTTTVTLVYQSYCKTTGWLGPPGDWQRPKGRKGRT